MFFEIRKFSELLAACMFAAVLFVAMPACAIPINFDDLSTPVTMRLEWRPTASDVPIDRMTFELTDFWGVWYLKLKNGEVERHEKAISESDVDTIVQMLKNTSNEIWIKSTSMSILSGEVALSLFRGKERYNLLPEGMSVGVPSEKVLRSLFSMLVKGIESSFGLDIGVSGRSGEDGVPWETLFTVAKRGTLSLEQQILLMEELDESEQGIMRENGSQLINGRWINSYDLSHGYYEQ